MQRHLFQKKPFEGEEVSPDKMPLPPATTEKEGTRELVPHTRQREDVKRDLNP